MDRMLYIGMTGAKESLLSQGLNNHNLANASTTGFKADLEQFRSMPVFGPGHPSRAYSMAERPGINYRGGAMDSTGRDLDVAIKGSGWIAIQGKDGAEAYTRAGNLHVSPNGQLLTGTGLPVMGNAGPIAIPPAQTLYIGTDGAITVRPLAQGPVALVAIDRIKLVNPDTDTIEKSADGLFRSIDGQVLVADANVNLVSGYLERSNVNVVESMVKMITLSRNFEMQVKAMKTAEETDEATQSLLRMS